MASPGNVKEKLLNKEKLLDNEDLLEKAPRHWVSLDDVLRLIGIHRKHWMIILCAGLGYGHYTSLTLAHSLATKSLWANWPELQDRPLYYNSIFAIAAGARLLGALFILPWCDRCGRRPFFFWATVFATLLSIASSFSPSYPIYCLLRGFVCVISSVLPAVTSVYALEMLPVEARGLPTILNQTISCSYIIVCTLINTAIDSSSKFEKGVQWRWAISLFMAPASIILAILITLWMETPRFQAANLQRPDLAWETLAKLCPGGAHGLRQRLKKLVEEDVDGGTASQEHTPLKGAGTVQKGDSLLSGRVQQGLVSNSEDPAEQLKEIKATYHFSGVDEDERRNERKRTFLGDIMYSLRQMRIVCAGKVYRQETFWISLCWVMQSFSHWGLTNFVTVFFSYIGINANWSTTGAFVVQLPSQLICYFLMQRGFVLFGRRWAGRIFSIQLYASCCSLCHLALALVLLCGGRGGAILTVLSLGCYFFGGPIWGPLYGYSAERYPTVLRASAMAYFACVAALSVIATTYVGSVTLSETSVWLYPMIWGVLRSTLAVISYFFKEETMTLPLEDTTASSGAESPPLNAVPGGPSSHVV